MQLDLIPRGRRHPRALDATPVPEPHGPGHEYTESARREETEADPGLVAVPIVHAPAESESAAAAGATATAEPPAPEAETVAEPDWTGWKVTDEFGRTVGKVESAAHPEWLVVRDRRGRHLLAPTAEAIAGGDSVFLPYEADLITAAPRLEGAHTPDDATAAAAREHYS